MSPKMETIIVTCNMEADLAYACIGPAYSDKFYEAHDATTSHLDDVVDAAIDTMERLEAEQDVLNEAAARAWAVAAVRIGAERGYDATPILTTDDSVLASQTKTYVGESDYSTVEGEIWQAAHDAIYIDVDSDGVWGVR